MAYRFRLIVLFFLSFFSLNSFAALSLQTVYSINNPIGFTAVNSDYSLLCSEFVSLWSSKNSLSVKPTVVSPSGCEWNYSSDTSGAAMWSIGIQASQSCPTNSSPSGSQCVCNSGYEEKNGNSCVLPEPPDTCKEIESTCSSFKNERIPRFDVYYSGSTPGGACSNPPLDNCSKGCYLQFTGISVYYKDNEGRSIASGPASFTGDSCVHSDQVTDPDPEKICKPGEFPDVVNGKNVCISRN